MVKTPLISVKDPFCLKLTKTCKGMLGIFVGMMSLILNSKLCSFITS